MKMRNKMILIIMRIKRNIMEKREKEAGREKERVKKRLVIGGKMNIKMKFFNFYFVE